MEYKIHQYRFDNFTKFEDIIKESLNFLGYNDSNLSSVKHIPDVNIYNHCHVSELYTDNNIIFKPTAPTSKHFALDTLGYANASTLAYEEPQLNDDITQMDWASIVELRNTKPNKWDDSILLKWRKPKKEIPDDHILIIGQMPDDETVKGFGYGSHLYKISDIAFRLKSIGENFIIKLHPSYKPKDKWEKDLLNRWKKFDFDVRTGYESVHDYLKKSRVVIVDNSTAGIDCLMHEVPLISYGWPEYHWATARLQTLPQLESLVSDLSWHNPVYSRMFIEWYINHYLCSDINSTIRRLKEIL